MESATSKGYRATPVSFTVTQKRARIPPGADLVPYIQTLTILVLSIGLLSWRNKSWHHRLIDVQASCLCLTVYYWKEPLIALGLAIVYTVCANLPGNWSSLNLPEYLDFKSRLEILASSDDDCMVCYDNDNSLARLPCDHTCCTGCLDLMAANYQTTCPACRKPLFSASDEIIYALSRGALAFVVANIALAFFVSLQDIRSSDYFGLIKTAVPMCAFVPYLRLYWDVLWTYGNDWWRVSFAATNMTASDLRAAVFALGSGVFLSSSILWQARGYFS